MSEEKTIINLINSYEELFSDILDVFKAFSNDKRLTILINLLTGEKSFYELKEETQLKKTALSNHLVKLIKANLIIKPEFNKYQITSDGELFLRVIESTYQKSDIKEKKKIDELQKRHFSDQFVKSFFG